MSDALTPTQVTLESAVPAGAPALELNEIQGDILIGLQKNFERFVFFEIADVAAFKSALRNRLARRITSTHTVKLREFTLRDHKNRNAKDVLRLPGVNIGFTQAGLDKLVPGVDVKDDSFKKGARKQAGALNDPVDGAGEPSSWVPEFLANAVDGVLLVTGGTEDAVDDEADEILAIAGTSINVSYDETAATRAGAERGHEHFGWKDGISQPGITGLTDPFPGQRLLDPGLFVFGYGPSATPALPWMTNGSMMVFRRLKQLVPEFEQFVLDQGAALEMDPVLLGARIVGRWKSGAPMALTPSQDDIALGGDPRHNNDFDFADDKAQRRCPFAAHIRKTNPREDFPPPITQQTGVDPHRIMRAGIPYGPEMSDAERAAHATAQDRGLMFVCYQTSIAEQFEFVQVRWANNPGFVFGHKHPDGTPVKAGFDPIIGQGPSPRDMDEPVPNYPTGNVRSRLSLAQNFVVPTAAGYFFMPSISALHNELAA